jgi:hypothetical protein
MAAPLTMSVILMALLDLGPDVENVFVYLEIPEGIPRNGLPALTLCGPPGKAAVNHLYMT